MYTTAFKIKKVNRVINSYGLEHHVCTENSEVLTLNRPQKKILKQLSNFLYFPFRSFVITKKK